MLKFVLFSMILLSSNCQYYESLFEFYNDDILGYLTSIEGACLSGIGEGLSILNTDDTEDPGFTPTEPENFTKDTFKIFIKEIEDFTEGYCL